MSIRLLIGDCREKLRELPDASVHCCVTSPPYFGLRDYQVAGQLGLEPTPDKYVAGMIEVFREVRRVLRDDGTLWLNIADSYAGGGGHSPNAPSSAYSKSGKYGEALKEGGIKPRGEIKAKDLCGIPWLLAFALRADGWYLRQEIIWAKPNPMPESVRDRCTKAHEQIFLLSKNPRYYFDAEAIAEPGSDTLPNGRPAPRAKYGGLMPSEARFGTYRSDASATQTGVPRVVEAHIRNKRSVWTVSTQPFSEAHFATYPPALIEPCVLAGCPELCCAKCGAPEHCRANSFRADGRTSCGCNSGTAAGTVLDPFAGAGTTGLVADRLNRNAVLIELNPEYAALAERRMTGDAPLFAEVRAA